uniref:ABCC10-like N-terminal domain-containing protein n=1 Tax=Quercus lobata TaxID=97700 RepID=A0A7N2L0J3_QUELO
MVKSLWTDFCGNFWQEDESTCNYDIISIFQPYICTNHRLVFSLDLLLLVIFLHVMVYRSFSRKNTAPSKSKHFSLKLICSAIYNGGLGLGIWIIGENLDAKKAILALHGRLVLLFQGFTWMLLDFAVIIEKLRLPTVTTAKLCYIASFLFAGFLCFSSLWVAFVDKRASIKMVLNVLSFPGAILLLLLAFQEHRYMEIDPDIRYDTLYAHLPGEEASNTGENCSNENVNPFAKAGFLSKMSIWWLNPLTKHVSVAIFWGCYCFGIPLSASNVFTFLASLHIVQELLIRMIPNVAEVFIEAKVSLTRILKFLVAPKLQNRYARQKCNEKDKFQGH